MMGIEATLNTRLLEFSGLAALVSDRIYPNVKPEDAAQPSVTFRNVTSPRSSAMGVDVEVVKARFQIDVWALTYDEAIAVRDQVQAAVRRWRNTSPGSVVQDTFILNGGTDLYEADTKQQHIAIDIEINYIE
jgi:hypothetical protein